jgi:hypothetical protein
MGQKENIESGAGEVAKRKREKKKSEAIEHGASLIPLFQAAMLFHFQQRPLRP